VATEVPGATRDYLEPIVSSIVSLGRPLFGGNDALFAQLARSAAAQAMSACPGVMRG